MKGRQKSLFEADRLNLPGAINQSIESLRIYGERYQHWAVAYSGGKDSSAVVTLVAWAIREGIVSPQSLTVLYADTRQELPPLHATAMRVLDRLRAAGHATRVVLPRMEDRFYVYMLGRGVPPPSNRFRWCTPKLKIEPMIAALEQAHGQAGEKLLMITGVRLGESAARDQRISISCSRDSGECGTGWMQVSAPAALTDTLAPIVHWRVCHVFDWLYFEQPRHGYDEVADIAAVYGDDDVRTGCIGCPLASRDNALERVVKQPEWEYLSPLLELKTMFRQMKAPRWRKRKASPEIRQSGGYAKNGQRMGPLTMEARAYWLTKILAVQNRVNGAASGRPLIDLINDEEERAIRQMWDNNVWPQKWGEDDINANVLIDQISAIGDELVVQPHLWSTSP